MAEESHALEEGSALRADSARLTREKKKLRTEILHTKEMRATAQARIGQLSAQAAKLRTLVHQLEAFHGLVSDVSELQEICESNTAAGVPPSKTAQERSLSLSVPHLLAMLHETTHNVEYLRGINATYDYSLPFVRWVSIASRMPSRPHALQSREVFGAPRRAVADTYHALYYFTN